MTSDKTANSRRPDIGIRAWRLASTIRPDDVAELHALHLMNQHPTQCPTAPQHWRGDGAYLRMRKLGLIDAETVEGWPRGYRRARVTVLGFHVLMLIAKRAMQAQGVMASDDLYDEAEAA